MKLLNAKERRELAEAAVAIAAQPRTYRWPKDRPTQATIIALLQTIQSAYDPGTVAFDYATYALNILEQNPYG